jgi:hypothetical protein
MTHQVPGGIRTPTLRHRLLELLQTSNISQPFSTLFFKQSTLFEIHLKYHKLQKTERYCHMAPQRLDVHICF